MARAYNFLDLFSQFDESSKWVMVHDVYMFYRPYSTLQYTVKKLFADFLHLRCKYMHTESIEYT